MMFIDLLLSNGNSKDDQKILDAALNCRTHDLDGTIYLASNKASHYVIGTTITVNRIIYHVSHNAAIEWC